MGDALKSLVDPSSGRLNLLGAFTGDNQVERDVRDATYRKLLGSIDSADLAAQQKLAGQIASRSLEGQQAFASQVGDEAGAAKAGELKAAGRGGLAGAQEAAGAAIAAQRAYDVGPEKMSDLRASQAALRKLVGPLAGTMTQSNLGAVAQNEISGQMAEGRNIASEGRAEGRQLAQEDRAYGRTLATEGRTEGRQLAREGRAEARAIAQEQRIFAQNRQPAVDADASARRALEVIRPTLDNNSELAKSTDAFMAANIPVGDGLYTKFLDTTRSSFPRTTLNALPTSTKGKAIADIQSSRENVRRLDSIINTIKGDPFLFTLPAEAIAKTTGFIKRATTFDIAPELRSRFATLRSELAQGSNLYVKDITGAQFSAAELPRYLAVYPDKDDDNVTAMAKAMVVRQYHIDRADAQRKLLDQGISWDSNEAVEAKRALMRDVGEKLATLDEASGQEKFDLVTGGGLEPGEPSQADPLKNADGSINREAAERYLRETEGLTSGQ